MFHPALSFRSDPPGRGLARTNPFVDDLADLIDDAAGGVL